MREVIVSVLIIMVIFAVAAIWHSIENKRALKFRKARVHMMELQECLRWLGELQALTYRIYSVCDEYAFLREIGAEAKEEYPEFVRAIRLLRTKGTCGASRYSAVIEALDTEVRTGMVDAFTKEFFKDIEGMGNEFFEMGDSQMFETINKRIEQYEKELESITEEVGKVFEQVLKQVFKD